MLVIEMFLLLLLLVGVVMLTWGAQRFNLGQRSLTITLAMTAISWLAFLIVTIALLVSFYINNSA